MDRAAAAAHNWMVAPTPAACGPLPKCRGRPSASAARSSSPASPLNAAGQQARPQLGRERSGWFVLPGCSPAVCLGNQTQIRWRTPAHRVQQPSMPPAAAPAAAAAAPDGTPGQQSPFWLCCMYSSVASIASYTAVSMPSNAAACKQNPFTTLVARLCNGCRPCPATCRINCADEQQGSHHDCNCR